MNRQISFYRGDTKRSRGINNQPRPLTGERQGCLQNQSCLLLYPSMASRQIQHPRYTRVVPPFLVSLKINEESQVSLQHRVGIFTHRVGSLPPALRASTLSETIVHVLVSAGSGCPPTMMRLKNSRHCLLLSLRWLPGQILPHHRALSE